jgi:subtilase family serine protease
LVEEVSKDRMTIRFSGTAAQVEGTFHTEIHNLMVKGEPHIANMSDPQIPMALEAVVLGPKALHNFLPRPLHRLGGKVTRDPETGKWERVAGTGAAAPILDLNGLKTKPEIVFSCGTGCQLEDVTPYDFAAIYNVQPLWNSLINGTGQTIAVAGTSDINLADVTSFRSTFGLPAGLTPIIKLAHGTDPGRCTGTSGACTLNDQIENALDVEWSGAVAPGAQIELVVSGFTGSADDTVYDSSFYVVNNNIAKILNVSYGLCELELGTTGNSTYNNLWQTAASAGIAVFVASGDSGSPSCDQGVASQGPYGAQFGLTVSGLASSPFVTAVGGTDLNWDASQSTYWNTTNSTKGATAKGYIQETPWNDSCTNPVIVASINQQLSTSYSASQICYLIATQQIVSNQNEQAVLNLVNTDGAGGGASNCTTNSTSSTTTIPDPTSCSGGYSKPVWQAGVTGIPSDGKRDIPDVSFFASNGFFGSAYIICVSDWGTCVTTPFSTTEPAAGEIGGTSASSPAMAGVMALINQKAGSAQGNPNSELYTLAGKQTYASCKTETVANSSSCYFNDIDTGTIAMPCIANSPNCNVATTGNTYGALSGFAAGVGFDNATGLGTLNVANVVNGWTAAVTGTNTATVAVSATPTTFTGQQGTSVTVTVTGSSGTPTGTIILTSGSFASATKTLASGTVTFALSPGVLAVGTDTITAAYSGDAVYAANTGTTTVTVTAVSFTLTAAATSPASIAAGGTATSDITVASTNGYAGTVTLSCALTSGPSGAVESPTCAATSGKSTVTLSSGTTSGTGQVTVSTTAAPAGAPHVAKANTGWFRAAGGAALASLVLFFLPGWSRRYRNVFCVLLVVIAGSFLAIGCGGGSSGGGTKKSTATVTVTPAKTSISETDTLSVAIAVAGSGGTATIPGGTVTLKSGSYTSAATTLSGGAATITIPAGTLALGATDTLTASYSGDTNYNSATGTGSVQVNKAATTSGTYTFTVTGTGNDAASTTATTTFTVTVN